MGREWTIWTMMDVMDGTGSTMPFSKKSFAEQLRVKSRPATERGLYHGFMRDMMALFEAGGVAISPLIALRLQDVYAHFRMVQMLEARLAAAECAEAVVDKDLLTLVEAVAKARERLRKSVNELEDCGGKAGAPLEGGIADVLMPLFEQYGDVLDPENPLFVGEAAGAGEGGAKADRTDGSDRSDGMEEEPKRTEVPVAAVVAGGSCGGAGGGGGPGNAGIPARSSGVPQVPALASSFGLGPFRLVHGLVQSLRGRSRLRWVKRPAAPVEERARMPAVPGPPAPPPPPEENTGGLVVARNANSGVSLLHEIPYLVSMSTACGERVRDYQAAAGRGSCGAADGGDGLLPLQEVL
jgi:hypothetical protein